MLAASGHFPAVGLGIMRALILLLTIITSGCAVWPLGKEPLQTIEYADSTSRSKTLFVLLPGIYDGNRTFARQDFITIARVHGVAADFIAADTDVGYYMAETVVQRLHQDVILPARRAGYERIWLVGVSLGGLGALLYLRDHPDLVNGVVLLSPYLGGHHTVGPIAKAGSLAAWQPPAGCTDENLCGLWRWLQQVTGSAAAPQTAHLFLGYGDEDRYPVAHRLLAEALGPRRSVTVPGGHDWNTWQVLWRRYLQTHWHGEQTERR